MTRLGWLPVWLLLVCCSAKAQHTFYHIFLDKGLSDARVNAITQDKYGFMWFGTRNGLNRFDGYTMRSFFASDTTTGLRDSHILALHSDRAGRLWTGTSNGLMRYDFQRDRFVPADTADGLNNARIQCFAEDAGGNLYVGTRKGLFRLAAGQQYWENLSESLGLGDRLIRLRGLHLFDDSTLYATTENTGFFRVNTRRKQGRLIPFKMPYADTCCLYMLGMQRVGDSVLLIGTLAHGLVGYNIPKEAFFKVDGPLSHDDAIQFNTTYQILRDRSGHYWVASYYFGLAAYLPDRQVTVSHRSLSRNPFGFEDKTAYCLYEDRQGNIWIGTATMGVYRFYPAQEAVRFYSQDKEYPGALQPGHVIGMAGVGKNGLLVGLDAGPSLYDRTTNRFTNFTGTGRDMGNRPLEYVQCAATDGKGIVWMGTYRLGLVRMDPRTKQFTVLSRFSRPYPLEEDGVSEILPLRGDSLLLVGWNRIATVQASTLRSTSKQRDTLPLYKLTEVVSVCFSRDSSFVWIATSKGRLYRYDPRLRKLDADADLAEIFGNKLQVHKIVTDPDGRLWLATNLGAVMHSGSESRLFPFQPGNNDAGEVKAILPQGRHVWMTNNRLLARLDPQSGRIQYLGEKEGIVNVQLFGSSLALSPWQTVLIGCNRGFYEIFPDRLLSDEQAEPAYITGLQVNNEPYAGLGPVGNLDRIRLRHWQNDVAFSVSAFDYAAGNDVEYAYKLEDFDADWRYLGRSRNLSYTNVPGGSYTLLLKTRRSGGAWNEAGQRLRIDVETPWWQTAWFRIAALLLAAVVAYLYYRNRIRRIRLEEAGRRQVEMRINELENSVLRTQMSPHFIFNSLNTINAFISRNEPARANDYISRFAHLIRLILDHSRAKKIPLSDELGELEQYIQLEQLRFSGRFSYTLEVAPGMDPDLFEIPPLIIQPFAENAILHGLLPLQREGMLQITVRDEGHRLLCLVEDNGVGRKHHGSQSGQAPYKKSSHGIDITVKRIKLFNREHGLPDPVVIEDLQDPDGMSSGTRVQIPLARVPRF